MKPTVRFEEEAEREYRAAALWYEQHRAGLGSDFLDATDLVIRRIVRFPRAGARVPELPDDLPVRRAPVSRFPYHVVYLTTDTAVRILAIAHDKRAPVYWIDRV